MDKLKSTYRELLMAAYRDTGEAKIPAELHVSRPVRGGQCSYLSIDSHGLVDSGRRAPGARSRGPGRAALIQA